MIRLSTQDKPFLSNNLTEKLNQVKELGFNGFEADGSLLLNRFCELKEAVRESGVPVTSVCGGYRGWIGDFVDYRRKTALEDIKIILNRSKELGALGIVVPAAWGMFSFRLPPMVAPRPIEEDTKVLIDSLRELDAEGEKTQTKILLEPLNRYEDHMLNTIDDVGNLIIKGGFKNVLIMADFFHMNIEEKNIAVSLSKWKDYIGHVHIADSHRYQPGDGHMDFVSGFEALKDNNFSGVMAFECRVTGEDPYSEYKKSVDYIKESMKKAHLNF